MIRLDTADQGIFRSIIFFQDILKFLSFYKSKFNLYISHLKWEIFFEFGSMFCKLNYTLDTQLFRG